jgi:hypothetical protein
MMLAMAGSSALLAGCATSEGPQQPLPPIVVPPGARLLAYGSSGPPLFYTTRASETLYIYDENTEQVVAVTRTADIPPDEAAPPIDVNRLGVTLDPDHHYRVYGASGEAEGAPGQPPIPPVPPRPPLRSPASQP